jgi:prepilin-type N-terminal cleavage/methylation domain-containing protein
MRKSTNGFTIVELLVVIVVIAILATIVIVAYNGVQTSAKASSVASQLESTEKAFRLYAVQDGLTVWPADSAAISGVSANPTIKQFMDGSSLGQYMKQAPYLANTPSLTWFYDNDSDTRTSCTLKYAGTNIIIIGLDQSVATNVDSKIDDGNINCGRVRYDTTNSYFFYSLSYDSNMNTF